MAARQSHLGRKFLNLKILNFLLLPQNFTTNQGLHSKFSHPTPRTAYQCTYAKEMRWIGPKMTELEPFSWTRSKFVKIREFLEIAIFDILAEILILRYGPNFGAIDPIFFLLSNNCLYFRVLPWFNLKIWFLGWFEGWRWLRPPPSAVNFIKKEPRQVGLIDTRIFSYLNPIGH